MKKTTLTEDFNETYQPFWDEDDFAPHQLAINRSAALENGVVIENASFPDDFLAIVKWTFLYLPGAAAIHFIVLGFALLFFYRDWGSEMMLGTLGIFAVAVFMIMLGIGKLSDLKYLKVVGSILLTSALAAILYSVLVAFAAGDFFGFFAKITLPPAVLIGYLVKRNLDNSEELKKD